MKKLIFKFILCFSILLLPLAAHAAVLCSVTSPGFSSAYVPANLVTNVTATSFSVTCSNTAGGRRARSSTVTYQLAANNGLNALGTQNRAKLGTKFINYSIATTSACNIPWKTPTVLPTPAATFVLASGAAVTNTYTFYGCIPPGQAALPPAGTYTDTVTMTFAVGRARGGGGRGTFTGGTFPVSIIAPASCTFTTPPGNLAFAYTAFQATPLLASATFSATCTTSLAYSVSLDATVGVVAGLNYTLALNTTASGGTNPLTSVGTGVAQTFFVNGSMAAGQAGACNSGAAPCSATQARTMTVTY